MTAIKRLLSILVVCFATSVTAQGAGATFTYLLPGSGISAITEDSQGFIWLGTAHGLCRYSGSNFLTYYASGAEGDLQNDLIRDLYYDSRRGAMWVCSDSGLSYLYEGSFHHKESTVYNPIMRVLSLDRDNIVVTARDGIAKVSKAGEYITRYYVPGLTWVTNLCVSSTGEVWFTYPIEDMIHLIVLDNDLLPLCDYPLPGVQAIYAHIANQDNTVWVSTDRGILAYNAASRQRIDLPEEVAAVCGASPIRFIKPYGSDAVLIGVADKGMYLYDIYAGSVERVFREQRLEEDSYVCFVDSHNNIWLSDGDSELLMYPSRQNYVHITPSGFGSSNFRRLSFDSEGVLYGQTFSEYGAYDLVSSRTKWSLLERSGATFHMLDSGGRLWLVSDHNKVRRYDVSGTSPVLLQTLTFDSDLTGIYEDSEGNIWFSKTFSCSLQRCEDIGSGRLTELPSPEGSSLSTAIKDEGSGKVYITAISGQIYECTPAGYVPARLGEVRSVSSVLTASDGTVWIGTYNEGLARFIPQTGRVERFGADRGLVSQDIRALLEDPDGNIWFSTPRNVTKYDVSADRFVTMHDSHMGTGSNYNLLSAAASSDGVLYFGGENGLTAINYRTRLDADDTDIPLFFQTITVNRDQLATIPDQIVLTHRDKVLNFLFSGLNFESGSLLNYSFKLEGYDKDWRNTTALQANYTNIPPGNYTFRVRVRLMNGDWSRSELSMPVKVKPSLWNSLPAKLLYALAGLVLLLAAFQISVKMKVKDERISLAEKREEISRSHIDFLSNISHEIRTPLSLIYAPLKELLKDESLSEHDRGLLQMMERNSEILNNLSAKLLDDAPKSVRRDERLQVSSVNLSNLALYSAENFRYAASKKDISLSPDIPEGISGYVDREKVEKILYNFLSNAVKYTPEHGAVGISLSERDGSAVFSVRDNGIGISEDRRKDIFERFNRLGVEDSNPQIQGSGIGLNYALYLARLHKGEINYAPNGPQGSVFELVIPVSKDSYAASEMADFVLKRPENQASDVSPKDKNAPNIVVAEDNDDVRLFLRELLSTGFNITTCSDGGEALESVKDTVPDLVLSDIIMPVMDGLELCRALKSNPDYCHIPVILLTAKNDSASSVSSMESGADAFVAKPFDPDYLRATINALLENRRRLQQRVLNLTSSTSGQEETLSDAGLSKQEKSFLEKLQKVVDEHLSDESFSVEVLAQEMAVSYSSLYAKVKNLTGHSPLTFLNTYRMNVAMEMLKKGDCSVAEVADSVGASTPFNFSRDFKKHFGVTPSSVLTRS